MAREDYSKTKNFIRNSNGITFQEREGGMFTAKPKKNGVNVEIKPAWSEAPQDFQGMVLLHKTEIDFCLS